jgi:hypothetical protein
MREAVFPSPSRDESRPALMDHQETPSSQTIIGDDSERILRLEGFTEPLAQGGLSGPVSESVHSPE